MTSIQRTSPLMNIGLWIAQLLVAATLIWAGYMKLFNPNDLPFPWVKDNPGLAKLTGIVDLLAGLGLILPGLFRVQTRLIIWAAYGTIVLMISAIIFHVSRGEASSTGFNFFVIALCSFIAWGRTKAPL